MGSVDEELVVFLGDVGQVAAHADHEIDAVAFGDLDELGEELTGFGGLGLGVLQKTVDENGFDVVVHRKDAADKTQEFTAGIERILGRFDEADGVVQTEDLAVVHVDVNDMAVRRLGKSVRFSDQVLSFTGPFAAYDQLYHGKNPPKMDCLDDYSTSG